MKRTTQDRAIGAIYQGRHQCLFRVWAPLAERVDVRLVEPQERLAPLKTRADGYCEGLLEDVPPGSQYFYRLNGESDFPDPAARYQRDGVHGPSEVVDLSFPWKDDDWRGVPFSDLIFYEIHVGTFSPQGSFDGVRARLDELKDLGVTALELMPLAQFPGNRNWGYDGVNLFAVQNSYGGPKGLQRLVQACHEKGLAVFLDLVVNHLGPEGNYLERFGPYFSPDLRTPWGPALNFDRRGSDQVRHFFLENALCWLRDFHLDGFRLDAADVIVDRTAIPFLEELGRAVRKESVRAGRRIHVIAESDANTTWFVRPIEQGGIALDGVWCNDFHYAMHSVLTGELNGYYNDFGSLELLNRALRDRFVLTGQYWSYRGRRHGRPAGDAPHRQFVVFNQNHDLVGNRSRGERLSQLASFEALKLAAAVLLLSPSTPLLFMGEEYGETRPFLYFTSHSDPAVAKSVRQGRRRACAALGWPDVPPDPQDKETFLRSRLQWELNGRQPNQSLRAFYKELISLRKRLPVCAEVDCVETGLACNDQALWMRRNSRSLTVACFNFGRRAARLTLPLPAGSWEKMLDSAERKWAGPGSRIPDRLTSSGRADLALKPYSAVAFALLER